MKNKCKRQRTLECCFAPLDSLRLHLLSTTSQQWHRLLQIIPLQMHAFLDLVHAKQQVPKYYLTKTRFRARLRASRFCVTAYIWHWRFLLGAYWKPGPEADSFGSSRRYAAAGSTAHRNGSNLQSSPSASGNSLQIPAASLLDMMHVKPRILNVQQSSVAKHETHEQESSLVSQIGLARRLILPEANPERRKTSMLTQDADAGIPCISRDPIRPLLSGLRCTHGCSNPTQQTHERDR